MAESPPVNDLLLPPLSLIQTCTARRRLSTSHTHNQAGNLEVSERPSRYLKAPVHFSFNDVRGCDRCAGVPL